MTDTERDAERERREAARAPMRAIHERDRDHPIRVLVVADRLPAREAVGYRLVSALAEQAHDIRVTVGVTAADADDVRRLEANGVETIVGTDPSWIADRPMHATVAVVLGPTAAARFGRHILEHQPQAAIVYDPSGQAPDDHVAARAEEAPLLAHASVVLAPMRGYEEFARELSPNAVVVGSAPGTADLDRSLAQALATCGVALPDAALLGAMSPDAALP